MKENRFSNKVKTKKSSELVGIIQSKSTYSESLVLAAFWELENRNELDENSKSRMRLLEEKNKRQMEIAQYKSSLIPPDMPLTIKLSAVFLYGVFMVEIVSILFFNRSTTVFIGAIVLPGSLITLAVGIFIHLGKYWARIALFVIFGFSTFFFFLMIKYIDGFSLTQQIFATASIVLILSKSSRDWYKKELPLNN